MSSLIKTKHAFSASNSSPAESLSPDDILLKWAELKTTNHHLHIPSAAALLKQPEAALIAARIGWGACALKPDIAGLLGAAPRLRRTLLAASNPIGVSLLIGQIDEVESTGDCLMLKGAHVQSRVSQSAARHAYYFEESDEMHGNSRSIVFFDAAGADVLKFHIFHKSALSESKDYIFSFKAEDQRREFAAAASQRPINAYDPAADSARADGDGLTVDVNANPQEVCASILQQVESYASMLQLEMITPYVRQTYYGPGVHSRADRQMIHLHGQTCRMHLRPAAVDRVQVHAAGNVVRALILLGKGRRLLVIRPHEPDAAWSSSLTAAGVRL
jgi:hypothetical protein